MSDKYAVWHDLQGVFHATSEKHANRKPMELHETLYSARKAAQLYNNIGHYAPAVKVEDKKEPDQCDLFA